MAVDRAPRRAEAGTNLIEYSVSELAFSLKQTVEEAYGLVRLRGEISGFRGQHASGHCYFTLKDEKACIDAVVWRSFYSRLRFKPEEGLEVIATGRVTTYPDRSKYQIVVEQLEPAGLGALMALLDERKRRLAAEGLFDEARKKPLPFLPRVIGVVTSPTGAVIRDILHRLADRCPSHVVVWPVRVQGETCAEEVTAAISGFNSVAPDGPARKPDLLIVARGGGSLEDLWGFNEEIVVRAAAASLIPLISAVGHETDWTLLDYVADWRAPTPTAAAERAVPVRADLLIQLAQHGLRMLGCLRRGLDGQRSRFRAASRGIPKGSAILGLPRQRFDGLARRLGSALSANGRQHRSRLERTARLRPHLLANRTRRCRDRLATLERSAQRALAAGLGARRARLDAQAALLVSLGPENVLARGFALVRDETGRIVRRASAVCPGEALDLQFADGAVRARAEQPVLKPAKARKAEAAADPQEPEPRGASRAPDSAAKSAAKQGRLF
jgi:exodeoxyribonuclease VII large subunit